MGERSLTRRPAVFLDRDGVLNHSVVRDGKPYPPDSLDELTIIDGTREALDRLKAAGFILLVVTNQPDVARGTQSQEAVEEMNRAMKQTLALDDFFTCYHDGGECDCRKPKPGLIYQGRDRYRIDLSRSYMIGDRWRDIDAGHSAGLKSLLIDYGYKERGPTREPEAKVKSLKEAADWILADAKAL